MDFGKLNSFIKKNRRPLVKIALGLWIFLIVLMIGTQMVQRTRAEVKELNRQIEYEKQRNALLDKLNHFQGQLDQYKKQLPPSADAKWLMNQITELAKSSGLELLSIQPEKLTPSPHFHESAVRVGIECSYHELGVFLQRIESSPIFLRIQKLVLEKIAAEIPQSESQPMVGRGRVEMVVHTFLLKE